MDQGDSAHPPQKPDNIAEWRSSQGRVARNAVIRGPPRRSSRPVERSWSDAQGFRTRDMPTRQDNRDINGSATLSWTNHGERRVHSNHDELQVWSNHDERQVHTNHDERQVHTNHDKRHIRTNHDERHIRTNHDERQGRTNHGERQVQTNYHRYDHSSSFTYNNKHPKHGCFNCGEYNHSQVNCRYDYRVKCNLCHYLGHKNDYVMFITHRYLAKKEIPEGLSVLKGAHLELTTLTLRAF